MERGEVEVGEANSSRAAVIRDSGRVMGSWWKCGCRKQEGFGRRGFLKWALEDGQEIKRRSNLKRHLRKKAF